MARLPVVGEDGNAWGTVLNEFLQVAHNSDGTLISGGSGGGDALSFNTLNGSTAVQDQTINISGSFSPYPDSRSLLAIVDPFKTTTEIREVRTLNSATNITLDRKLNYAHTSGVPVIFSLQQDISTYWFGCEADDSTDDWARLQRASYEAYWLNLPLTGATRLPHRFGQMLLLCSDVRNMQLTASTGISVSSDARCAAVMNGELATLVTGTASNNTFTSAAAHTFPAHGQLIFQNPTGETLPGGISANTMYFIVSTPTTTTFTVSTTDGGAAVDITSDGTAWAVVILNQGQIKLENLVIKGGTNSALNVLSLVTQQGCTHKDLQLYGGTGTGGTVFLVTGQIGNFYNVKLYPRATSDTCLRLWGLAEGHNFYGLNMAHYAGGSHTGIVMDETLELPYSGNTGVIMPSFFGLWTEAMSVAHLRIEAGTPFIAGWRASTSAGVTTAILQVENSRTYNIQGMLTSGANPTHVIVDTDRAYTLDNTGTRTIIQSIVQIVGSGDPTVVV